MLSVCLAIIIGMSWPVSALAIDTMNAHQDRTVSGPTLPILWFLGLLYLALAALNGAQDFAGITEIALGTFPMENNFSPLQTVKVFGGFVLGVFLVALIRGDVGRAVHRLFGRITTVWPDWLPSRDPVRIRQSAWIDCAALLYGEAIVREDLIQGVARFGEVSPERARKRLRYTYVSPGAMNAIVLPRLADQMSVPEARAFLRSLVQLGVALGAMDLADIVYLRVIGTELGLPRAAIAEILHNGGAYEAWKGPTASASGFDFGANGASGNGFGSGANSQSGFGQSFGQGFGQRAGGADAFGHGSRTGSGRSTAAPPPAEKTPRQILGVSRNADAAEIKRAYRKLARRYHPDRFAQAQMSEEDRAEITERMARINAAYDALK